MVIILYQFCRSRKRSDDGDDLSSLKKKLSDSKSVQERKVEEIAQKLAFFEKNNTDLQNYNNNLQSALGGDAGLKSNLKMERTNSDGLGKKSVRFADEY